MYATVPSVERDAVTLESATLASPKSRTLTRRFGQEHHVGRLQIPVDDTQPVGGTDALRDLPRDDERFDRRKRTLARDPRLQRLAFSVSPS
jgi:hypothetical protein